MDWEAAVQQLIQNQQNFGTTFAQFLTHMANAAPGVLSAIPAKKIVVTPEAYDRSPQKFHEWWSKVKVWIATTHATASNQQKAAAVYLHLEDPRAGCFVQVHLDECMAVNMWPTWVALQAEIEVFFLPGNNKEWARSQLLHLHQGPQQRIDNFLAQFQALKLQSECPNEYAKDLLERAVSQKILEQVYIQGLDRTTWLAQELFLINTMSPTQYFGTNHYTSSSGTPSGSGMPMDIGAANIHPQPHGKGLQCYNCQGFSQITSKIHIKCITSVSSPVSVSPNKYASLVVEDVDTQCTTDCADTTASFVSPSVPASTTVPSTGVPRSGLAPDVKRGVLNSHVSINGQKFPSLASSDSESPTDDLEVPFLVELRRTVTIEREVQIPV
ncbi:hypothetical protein SCLCIDRAFT_29600 [Scleroderma citrinum Foug A]|uniref:Retrotransposon gag domain-containing protein n=1 Tax=Scleroderma citrinum Foug A TaxID=1036808 RepID=A0A0C2Z3H3_9AGAM|nr:hypothetical protein SCLCIDRAFT_29600 [Scleroderma citrinum Foug A]